MLILILLLLILILLLLTLMLILLLLLLMSMLMSMLILLLLVRWRSLLCLRQLKGVCEADEFVNEGLKVCWLTLWHCYL